MKSKVLTFILLSILSFNYAQEFDSNYTHKKVQYDIYGRIILDENGNKIEYNQWDQNSQTSVVNECQNNPVLFTSLDTLLYTGNHSCQPLWQYSVMGQSIGRRSLNTVDIDNDGILEIICSAHPAGYNTLYWGFWYILKYNSISQQYEQIWVSESYNSNIRRIIVKDYNSDGIFEILVGYNNGVIHIYDAITKNIVNQITIPNNVAINDIQLCDADNDGNNEIAVSTNTNIFLFNITTLNLESQLPYGCFDFRVGNVDSDSLLELVTSNGKVIKYNGILDTVSWVCNNNLVLYMNILMELSDIDNDNMDEIILATEWDYIYVYDANTQSLKYTHNANSQLHTLLLQDVNNDNIDEIIYGDAQFGDINCLNAVTNTIMWEIPNPDNGITDVKIADVNNDGTLEVLWGANWTSTGEDHFYVADFNTHAIEWTSFADDGPFYGVEIVDVDNDGEDEIVAVSCESGEGNSGVITVFNYNTRQIEWRCNDTFMNYIWTGIFGIHVKDIDNDNVKEIIIAAGDTYDGKIWIINGITKNIESSHEFFFEDINVFVSSAIVDIDQDGQDEIIAGTQNQVYVINPLNFSIEWNSTNLAGYNGTNTYYGNVDNDTTKEIVVIRGYLYTFDAITHQQMQSVANNYTSLDIIDLNNDGKDEIVAGTFNGFIKIIDGATLQVIQSFDAINSTIDRIKVIDLNGDSIFEYVFTSNGTVYFSDLSKVQSTQRYDATAGKYNSLVFNDHNNDGYQELFIGTTNKIIEISSDCYSCLWYKVDPTITQVSCGNISDGSIQINHINGVSPYNYIWSSGSTDTAIYSLPINTYFVTVTDSRGCIAIDSMVLDQTPLFSTYTSSNVSCANFSDGSITVTPIYGVPPYSFLWSTGDTVNSIVGLDTGYYYYSLIDSVNCIMTDTIYIAKDTIIFDSFVTDVSCFGINNGSIITYKIEGEQPFNYLWNTGETNDSIFNLSAGVYSVIVTNSNGCHTELVDTVFQPTDIFTTLSSTPDNIMSLEGEGTATINISGGVQPYSIFWNDSLSQNTYTAINLHFGMIQVTVVDSNQCLKTDSIMIDTYQGIHNIIFNSNVKIFPNPTNGIFNIEVKDLNFNDLTFEVYNDEGKLIYPKQSIDPISLTKVDLSNLVSGVYFIVFNENDLRFQKSILFIK